ncbi:hypothetical protein SVAN01_04761, partial [Stagonosporopsis vannaccii]
PPGFRSVPREYGKTHYSKNAGGQEGNVDCVLGPVYTLTAKPQSVSGSPSTTMPNISASASPSPVFSQKRKWQTAVRCVLLAKPCTRNALEHIVLTSSQQIQYVSVPASPLRNQRLPQMPPNMPTRSPQLQQSNSLSLQDVPQMIFLAAIERNIELRQPDPTKNPVSSVRIDRTTHAMWDVVFENENWMKEVTTKASMLPQIKLRALAKLNYLPSWWFLRDMARMVMMRQRWILDDSDMQMLWNNTIEWCKRVESKVGIQGDSATPTNQAVSERRPAQQQAMKADS